MSEIRKDYVTDTWVVISEERAMRPKDYVKPRPPVVQKTCVFCEGNEKMTPPEIYAFRSEGTKADDPGWWIRTVPNKYPALRIEGELQKKSGSVFTSMTGIGCHEVVIESPAHDRSIALLETRQIRELLEMYRARLADLSGDRRFKYILIFENHGAEAGASLEHPHSQIIATPMIPVYVAGELRGAEHYYIDMGGECIYDTIIKEELAQSKRVVFENSSFVCLTPFASKYPYELMILPKRHSSSFVECSHHEIADLAEMLGNTLSSLYKVLEDPPYNFYIHTAPVNTREHPFYHWHIEIIPRVSKLAGFERGTGFYINSLSPENAAAQLSAVLYNTQTQDHIPTAETILRVPETN